MIRRDDGQDWLLISQVDHAHLAGEIAAVWGNGTVPPLPHPEWLVSAIRGHDDGWAIWEQAPRIDSANGKPREFLEMRMAEATAIWSRSIAACGTVPFGRVWVSRHFQHLAKLAIESRDDNDEDVAALQSFLEEQKQIEQEERTAAAALSIVGEEYDRHADRGFRFVQMFDRMSLWLCCAVRSKLQDFTNPDFGTVRFMPQPDGKTFVVDPFPLSVDHLKLTVPARRIPAKVYANDEAYRTALLNSPDEMLTWMISND